MKDLPHSKPQLRRHMRARRQALSAAARDDAALKVARHVEGVPGWQAAVKVAVYLAADGEVDPTIVASSLRANDKTPYLPVIQDDQSLRFAAWDAGSRLSDNRYGIPEPDGENLPAETMDIILLPLVAWDTAGNRLGMGGGFYDRTLAADEKVLTVGLGFELQKVGRLPAEPWDVRLDFIATECALHNCQDFS